MTNSNIDLSSETEPSFPPILPGKLILNGENPFIRQSLAPGLPLTSDASLWTINYSPKGAGHALFIKSELTDDKWRIYSDHLELVRWLQKTVQGMLNPETANDDIPIMEAEFSQAGNLQEGRWVQKARAVSDEIVMRWGDLIDPLLMVHNKPAELPQRLYGVSVVMIPALKAELTLNGQKASGQIWPCKYDGKPFSTASLAFSESWREAVDG